MDIDTLLRYSTIAHNTFRASPSKLYTNPWCIAGGAVRDALIGATPQDIDMYILGVEGFRSTRPQEFQMINDELEVQVMYTHHKTMEDLIRSFDWNVCWCAMGQDGTILNPFNLEEMIEGRDGRAMELRNVTNPYANLRRGYRFSERYNLKILTHDLHTLFRECLGRHNINGSLRDDVTYQEIDQRETSIRSRPAIGGQANVASPEGLSLRDIVEMTRLVSEGRPLQFEHINSPIISFDTEGDSVRENYEERR